MKPIFGLVLWRLLVFFYVVYFSSAGRPEFPEEIKEIVTHVHNTCVQKTSVSEEDITNCENGIFKEDTKLKCYMFCLMEEASFAEEDGSVDYDMMISMIPEEWKEKVSSMILACKHLDVPSKDKCQKTFDVHKCCYEQDPDTVGAASVRSRRHFDVRGDTWDIFAYSDGASSVYDTSTAPPAPSII